MQVGRVAAEELAGPSVGEPSAVVRARVLAARARQRDRHGVENARLPAAALGAAGGPTAAARRTLATAVDRLGLTARGYHRALRVARTIADLAGEDRIADHHVREALGLRHLPLAPGDASGAA